MDLSAAVNSTYLAQFTNAGLYAFSKTTGSLVSAVGLWSFWCSGKGVNGSQLSDCPSSPPIIAPYPGDVQIAHTNLYPGGRWVATTMSPDNTYLWLGISQGNNPVGLWYLWSFKSCQDYANVYPYMDQPILGVSQSAPGGCREGRRRNEVRDVEPATGGGRT